MQSNTINELATSKKNKVGHDIIIICAVFDQGRGFERGGGERNCHPFDGIFNIHVIDIFTTY